MEKRALRRNGDLIRKYLGKTKPSEKTSNNLFAFTKRNLMEAKAMKRILSVFLSAMIVLSLCACSKQTGFAKGGKQVENLVGFLENEITDKMSLENIVNVFEQMCGIPVEDDMILFETGTFSFTGEPLFQISFVRQFPDEDDEFYQLRVDIFYQPTNENSVFNEATWNEDLSENIFDYIRNSQVFSYAKDKEYIKVEIHLDQT